MNLTHWALKWNVPAAALADLRNELHMDDPAPAILPLQSEAYVQSAVKLEATRKGMRLFRNNVGMVAKDTQIGVRFGLANESRAVNSQFKSGDLIGIRPVIITPAHVGYTLGQFVSRECKPSGWRYTGTDREQAQSKWANMINLYGGDATFCTGEGTL